MSAAIEAPVELVESPASLRFPTRTAERLQRLMDRNSLGALSSSEREELEDLVDLSEAMSLLRAEALRLLGRKPLLPDSPRHILALIADESLELPDRRISQ
jgi:hypothetical protein